MGIKAEEHKEVETGRRGAYACVASVQVEPGSLFSLQLLVLCLHFALNVWHDGLVVLEFH